MTAAKLPLGMPRILYTFAGPNGGRHALAVDDNLAPMPNAYGVEEAMLNPRTPLAVRTMLFNKLINRVRPVYERVDAAEAVHLRHLRDGTAFLEVRLSPKGLEHVKQLHTRKTGYYPIPDYELFDPTAPDAARKYAKFTKPLKRALAKIGLYK